MQTMQWEDIARRNIGPIEQEEKPFCVFSCSDVFIYLHCDERQSCSEAVFNVEPFEITYKSKISCRDSDNILIIDSEAHSGSSTTCENGVLKQGSSGLTVNEYVMGSNKKIDIHCHDSCHESLILNNCNGEDGCKSAKMGADKSLYCEDANFIMQASADNWKSRATKVEQILRPTGFKQLKCSNEGWNGDGDKIIDFAKYPQNDINVACISKCSEHFVKNSSAASIAPIKSNSELKCPNEGFIRINGKIAMQDLKCDPTKGWHEERSGKLIVDFEHDDFSFTAKCKNSCTDEFILPDCGGHKGCVEPVLIDKKLTCDTEGTVMRVNGQFEFDHLLCSREFWTMTDPVENTIPRKTYDETISVACLPKCDHSFIKPSACVAETTCDPFQSSASEAKITCANPKDYIVMNSIISASSFSCHSVGGWSNGEGVKAGDFAKNELELEAHCFRNCDESRIENACNGGPGCAKFLYKNDVLSCPAGYVLNVNNKDVFEDVQCEAGGFKTTSDASFLLKFDVTNTQERLSATCVSKCDAKFVNLTCDVHPCALPLLSDNKLKCPDSEDLLVLGPTPVFSSSLHCDPLSGWKEADMVVHDLSGTSVHVRATCRQLCNKEMVTLLQPTRRKRGDMADVMLYQKSGELRCAEPKNHKLMLNGVETGTVKCGAMGWLDADQGYAVKFTADGPGNVTAECKHKCDARFVQQECNGGETCSDAIYVDKRLSCAHPSELLVIDGIESQADLTCSDLGWEDGSKLIVDKKSGKSSYTVEVQCLQLCHPSFVTLKEGSAPFNYSLGGKLTCSNHSEMLVAHNVSAYSDLVCTKEGWKKEGEVKVLIPFHGPKHERKITAGCDLNDCFSRGFAPPCGADATNECISPNHTAYSMFCTEPFKLVPNMESMLEVSPLTCKDGKWHDDQNTPIKEGDETPMQLQCFAKDCVKCEDTLLKGCPRNEHKFCADRSYRKGRMRDCSKYECDYWWMIRDGESFHFSKTSVTCDENGNDYKWGNTTLTSTLDCVRHPICSIHSPLVTSCEGLQQKCMDNFLDRINKKFHYMPADCPAPNQLYYKTGENQWEEGTILKCDMEGKWTMVMKEEGSVKEIPNGARVICASGDPVASTTTSSPTTTTDDPKTPCVGCRKTHQLRRCDGCATKDEEKLSFKNEGYYCVAKSSTGVFELGNGRRVYDIIHCKFEDRKYVWRTLDEEEVAEFAPHRSSPPFFHEAHQLGVVLAICALTLGGIIGAILLFLWYRKREEQKRIAAATKGLEQKNDDIIDAISVDSVKTLKI